MTRLRSLRLWLAKRYGTLTRKDGRWRRYRYIEYKGKLPDEFYRQTNVRHVLYDCHLILSSRRLLDVLFWPKVIPDQSVVQGDVRFWIEHSATNIFAPGLNWLEYVGEQKSLSILSVAIVSEKMENLDYWINNTPDIATAGFLDPQEAVLFKLRFG